MGAGNAPANRGHGVHQRRPTDKPVAIEVARELREMGFAMVATRGTAAAIEAAGIPVAWVNKVAEGRPHIVDMIKNDEIVLVINTVDGSARRSPTRARSGTSALATKVSIFTTIEGRARRVRHAPPRTVWTDVYSVQGLHAELEAASMNKTPLTVAGAEKLRTELHRLKTVERPNVIAAIAEARRTATLENAEYEAAKDRQGFIEGRIGGRVQARQRADHRSDTAARCGRSGACSAPRSSSKTWTAARS